MPKFLGRHIMVKGKYVEAILSGRKRATIRVGIVKPKYNELIIHGGGKPVAKVRITNIVYKKVRDLTDHDAKLDGFNSREELLRELERVYGFVKPEDNVTIIEFEVIQDLSKLEIADPYMGLTPQDIARISLRYLSNILKDEEKKILKSLTETGSIRMTAIHLFGTLDARWRVRRVLKKALNELVKMGIIGRVANTDKMASKMQ